MVLVHVCVPSCFSRSRLYATLWTGTHQTPLSKGFSRQEHWSGLPYPPPGNVPDPQIESMSPASSAFQVDSLLLSHWGSLMIHVIIYSYQPNLDGSHWKSVTWRIRGGGTQNAKFKQRQKKNLHYGLRYSRINPWLSRAKGWSGVSFDDCHRPESPREQHFCCCSRPHPYLNWTRQTASRKHPPGNGLTLVHAARLPELLRTSFTYRFAPVYLLLYNKLLQSLMASTNTHFFAQFLWISVAGPA